MQVGNFDPLTRTPLTPERVFPNLALKEAVQAFLAEHGWAYKTY
jgi:STIP1 family protein 1